MQDLGYRFKDLGLKINNIIIILIFNVILNAQVMVATSANVSFAINSLIKEFNKTYPNIKITPIISSSGKLTSQIINQAPFDIFLSADTFYPNKLYNLKISKTIPIIYAYGKLALFSPKKRDFSKKLKILLNNNIKKIAIANPKTAPYGKAAFEALKRAKILNKIKNKLIFAESISQTFYYTLKAADIGIVAMSAFYSKKFSRFKKNINWIEVNQKLYSPIAQAMVLLKDKNEAKLFFNFLQSKKAKKIFKKFGYGIK